MVNDEVDNLQNQEKMLMVRKHARRLEVLQLENEHELLRAAADMAVDDQHSVDFYIGELNKQVEEKRRNIMALRSQWTALKQTFEERKQTLGQSIHSLEPGVQEKLDQLKEIERETESIISKIQKQVVEHAKLLEELERLPKLPPRKSYIQRITEITKSSKKQDADIDRILKETRELQLESNTVQERLARTYAVVDETVFREAKKDAIGRQVYRLLTSIHDSFEQISEKILTTDRARREAADLEVKLASLSSRSFDINKLQTDLDSLRKENDLLEQQVHRDSS
ncbi:coiled-coil domain-containing protein 22-like protein [Iris pallida]|uniref:Coiled-coil domain-containing protein 22-like protein n=1 Tax=Iris pallida TaxID=29817 RepID=A0AAX6G8M1_IRIPA|nr:coiled-coil domain-containing protein 22-like protein [Iris pallida]